MKTLVAVIVAIMAGVMICMSSLAYTGIGEISFSAKDGEPEEIREDDDYWGMHQWKHRHQQHREIAYDMEQCCTDQQYRYDSSYEYGYEWDPLSPYLCGPSAPCDNCSELLYC